jgi:hypothetical protein
LIPVKTSALINQPVVKACITSTLAVLCTTQTDRIQSGIASGHHLERVSKCFYHKSLLGFALYASILHSMIRPRLFLPQLHDRLNMLQRHASSDNVMIKRQAYIATP